MRLKSHPGRLGIWGLDMAYLVTTLIQLINIINMQSATMFQKVSITKPTAAVRYVDMTM